MKKFLIILILVVGFFIAKLFYQAGQFKTLEPHFNGEVTDIYDNIPGPEDLQMDHLTGNLFISASNRRPGTSTNDGIYLLNVEDNQSPKLLFNDFSGVFHPHGISLLRIDSTVYVFAVNHNKKGNFVESFKFYNDSLEHLASYSSEAMCCPNDIVAIDKDKFYVTNDHGSKNGLMRVVEDYLRVPRSSLLYYNGEAFSEVAAPFHYANGVNVSPDKKRLYIATTTGASLLTFDINDDGTLEERHIEYLATGVDNIDVDAEGNLWIGAHPKLLNFLKHAKDSTEFSPSQVLKLTSTEDSSFTVEEIYLNDGSEISGSSVAVYYKGELFIGVVFDYALLRASIKE